MTDLLYDGEAFTLYEAPMLDRPALEGASSAFALALLKARLDGQSYEDSARLAKHFVTDSLRRAAPDAFAPAFFAPLYPAADAS